MRRQPATYERLERHGDVGQGEDRASGGIDPVAAEPLDDDAKAAAGGVHRAGLDACRSQYASGWTYAATKTPTSSSRASAQVEALNDLGGLAESWERDGGLVIRGYSCPLAGVTPDHPEVCSMAETLVAELAGVSVHERCDRGERPRCFKVATPDGTE